MSIKIFIFISVIMLGIFPDESAKQKKDQLTIRTIIKTIQDGRRLVAYQYHVSIGKTPVPVAMRKDAAKETLDSDTLSKIDQRIADITTALRDFKKN